MNAERWREKCRRYLILANDLTCADRAPLDEHVVAASQSWAAHSATRLTVAA